MKNFIHPSRLLVVISKLVKRNNSNVKVTRTAKETLIYNRNYFMSKDSVYFVANDNFVLIRFPKEDKTFIFSKEMFSSEFEFNLFKSDMLDSTYLENNNLLSMEIADSRSYKLREYM